MRMSGDMRNKLLDAIIDIMENTTEFCNYDFRFYVCLHSLDLTVSMSQW